MATVQSRYYIAGAWPKGSSDVHIPQPPQPPGPVLCASPATQRTGRGMERQEDVDVAHELSDVLLVLSDGRTLRAASQFLAFSSPILRDALRCRGGQTARPACGSMPEDQMPRLPASDTCMLMHEIGSHMQSAAGCMVQHVARPWVAGGRELRGLDSTAQVPVHTL